MDPTLFRDEWHSLPRRRFSRLELRYNGSDPDGDDSEGNPKTFRRVCERFAERTSMQGIPYVYVSSSVHAKVLWVVIFILGCVAMSAHLYLLISQYYRFETQTQVDLGFSALSFPAITVCNVNRIRKTMLGMASQQLRELVEEIQPENIAASMEQYRKIPPDKRNEQSGTNSPPEPTDPVDPAALVAPAIPADPYDSADNTDATDSAATPAVSPSPSTSADTSQVLHQPSTSVSQSVNSGGQSTTPSINIQTNPTSGAATTTPASNSGSATSTSPGPISGKSRQDSTLKSPSSTLSSGNHSGSHPAGTTPVSPFGNPGSETGSTGSIPQPPPPPGPGRRKKRSTARDVMQKAHMRVKRFITGFDVNKTNSRYDQNAAEQELNVYSTNKSTNRKIEDELRYLYSINDRKARKEMGHDIQDMLVSCTFGGYECYDTDFKLFQSADYGNCYTVENANFISVGGGPSDGLELLMYLEKDEYVDGMTNTKAGLQLLVHEPGTWPLPFRKGFAVSAAMETFVALRQINLNRESSPYGNCQNGDSDLDTANIKYTRTACQVLCQQKKIYENCDCYDASYEELFIRIWNDSYVDFCMSDSELECLRGVESDFLSGDLQCSCENACKEKDYTQTHSFRVWPSDAYATVLAQTLCAVYETECDVYLAQSPESLRENFIKLNIYFEDLNYEDITEKPDYEETQFISDVGGTIGLWIGLSVISFFEVLQFFYEALHYLVVVKPRQRRLLREAKKKRENSDQRTVRSVPTLTSTVSSGFPKNTMPRLYSTDSPENAYTGRI